MTIEHFLKMRHTITLISTDDNRLDLSPYTVKTFTSAEAALAGMPTGDAPSAIILDLADPFDLCRELTAQYGLPVLLLLDDDDDATLERLQAAGAADYVLRPARASVLRHRVERAIGTQSRTSPDSQITELVIETAQIGVWDWNMQTGEMYYSPMWFQVLGYEAGDVAPNFDGWLALVHPEDRPRVLAAFRDESGIDQLYSVEYRILLKDKTFAWMRALGHIVARDADGNPCRMVGIQRNIHDTIEMEEALRKSEERHRIISETITDYAYSYIVRENGSLKKDWSTQAFHEITGFTFGEMDEDGWGRLIHPDDIPAAQKRYERLLNGEVDVTEFRIITKSGEVRWLRDHGHPVYSEEAGRVVHIYGAAQDVTERRHFEEQLQYQTNELRARNEELDAFAYTVAHDLKNPIASMMGFASLVQNYYDRMTPDKVMEYINLILESGYKLKDIIDALLMLAGVSKMKEAELTPLDMQIIVDDCRRRLASMIAEHDATIITPDEWPTVVGYGPWVEEVWTNYLSNALKYGGQPPRIELGAQIDSDEMVRFYVRDNGRGLTPDEQNRVFTPFTRLNQAKIEGHGLGLSIVQRIVHKLGGDVRVESEPGQGSTFSFTLPVEAPSAGRGERRA